jgi:hypothetical protein
MARTKDAIQIAAKQRAPLPAHPLHLLDRSLGSIDMLAQRHAEQAVQFFDAHIAEAAELLVCMGEAMQAHGVRRIDDPRVSADFRQLWQRLVDSKALEALSDAQRRVLIGFVARPRTKACEIPSRRTEPPCGPPHRDPPRGAAVSAL